MNYSELDMIEHVYECLTLASSPLYFWCDTHLVAYSLHIRYFLCLHIYHFTHYAPNLFRLLSPRLLVMTQK